MEPGAGRGVILGVQGGGGEVGLITIMKNWLKSGTPIPSEILKFLFSFQYKLILTLENFHGMGIPNFVLEKLITDFS